MKKYLVDRAISEIKPDDDLLILTIASAIVASLGVSMGNIAVIIGSMLIAPFFDPIISLVVLMTAGEMKHVLNALRSFFLITFTAILVSTAVFVILRLFGDIGDYSVSNLLTIEYFAIAMVLGVVGILMWIWPTSSSTTAGISVAISLMPPLAFTAKEIVMLNWNGALSFFLLYLLNAIGIIVGGYLVVMIKGRKQN